MSTIETDLAPKINMRRQQIFGIDVELRALNKAFPNERTKPMDQQDPSYLAKRSEILEIRRSLSGRQHQARHQLRRIR